MTTTKVVPGQLVAAIDVEHVASEAAARISKSLRNTIKIEGRATIALSGGNTPRAAYALLAKDTSLDWSKVEVFWADERAVSPTHARSNYKLAKETLLDAAKIPADNIHRMPADAASLDQGARDYEALLREVVLEGGEGVPTLDVVVLGIGEDGHTASLFPGESAVDETARLVVGVPAKGDREARLTITPPMIEHVRAAFILATGASKSPSLERAWSIDGNMKDTPARVLRGVRGAVTWIIDREAGGVMTGSSAKIKL
jgi:6-phosphogluconolactonase